jgi:hypothetical protein
MEPIRETAHYVVRGDGTDLYLHQEGRVEESGVAPILWDRGAEAAPPQPGQGARGPLGAARRRAARILASVFHLALLALI